MRLPKQPNTDEIMREKYQPLIYNYVTKHLFTFVRAFGNLSEMRHVQNEIQEIKHQLLSQAGEKGRLREQLLSTFNVGEKIMTMESDRIPLKNLLF